MPPEPDLVSCPPLSHRSSSPFSLVLQPPELAGSSCQLQVMRTTAPLPWLRGDRGFLSHTYRLLWDTDPLISRFPAAAVAIILIGDASQSISSYNCLNPEAEFLTGRAFSPSCWRRWQGTLTFPSGPGRPAPTAPSFCHPGSSFDVLP